MQSTIKNKHFEHSDTVTQSISW